MNTVVELQTYLNNTQYDVTVILITFANTRLFITHCIVSI